MIIVTNIATKKLVERCSQRVSTIFNLGFIRILNYEASSCCSNLSKVLILTQIKFNHGVMLFFAKLLM